MTDRVIEFLPWNVYIAQRENCRVINLRPFQEVPNHEGMRLSLVYCIQGGLIEHDEGSLNKCNRFVRLGLRHNGLKRAIHSENKCQWLGCCIDHVPLSGNRGF